MTAEEALIAKLLPVHRKRIESSHGAGGAWAGTRSRLKRLYVEERVAAGRPMKQAWEMANKLDAIARKRADRAVLMAQLGAS